MRFELPTSLMVNGSEYAIRTDFRDILNIIVALNDPNLKDEEKVFIFLYILYVDFESINKKDYKEAFDEGKKFMNYGMSSEESSSTRIMDFEQDEALIMAAVNKVYGKEIRNEEYVHWWTFMGYYMEIGECVYSTVLNIRQKKIKQKPLEKWEIEFYRSNKSLCLLKEKLSYEEQAEKDALNELTK